MGTQYRAGRALRAARRSARPRRCSPSGMAAPTTMRTTRSICRPTRCASSTSAMPISCTPIPRPATATPKRRCARSSSAAPCRWSLGGDHAVNIPCIRAFSEQAPIHIVQIDAHLDFVDVRHGVREGHGNPMRRAVGAGARHRPDAARHPQRLVDRARGLRGCAEPRFDDPLGAPVPAARHRGRAGADPGGRALLRHDRHRRVRPVDRAGHRHAQPWRLPLLGGHGAPAGHCQAGRGRGHRSRRGRAGL